MITRTHDQRGQALSPHGSFTHELRRAVGEPASCVECSESHSRAARELGPAQFRRQRYCERQQDQRRQPQASRNHMITVATARRGASIRPSSRAILAVDFDLAWYAGTHGLVDGRAGSSRIIRRPRLLLNCDWCQCCHPERELVEAFCPLRPFHSTRHGNSHDWFSSSQ
jgi:hypothetical protein